MFKSSPRTSRGSLRWVRLWFLFDIILMLHKVARPLGQLILPGGSAWRSDSALYCIHSTSTLKNRETINSQALLSGVCKNNVCLPGADHVQVHSMFFPDSHDTLTRWALLLPLLSGWRGS